MRTLVVLLLALGTTGCIPIIYSERYEGGSRQNLPDAVPAFIETGKTTMANVVLALGDPDTVAQDESWIAYVSSYREGGGGAALVMFAGGSGGLFGGAKEKMLYRRLLVRFDSAGIVTDAKFDLVRCSNTDVFIGTGSGTSPPCFDVASTDVVAGDLEARLRAAGETNIVVYPDAEWLSTHQRGMVVVSDTAIHFVPTGIYRTPKFPDVDIAFADLTGTEIAGSAFHLVPEHRRRVQLKHDDTVVAEFTLFKAAIYNAEKTLEAGELLSQRLAAGRR